jgi:shikimate dehydrogenase
MNFLSYDDIDQGVIKNHDLLINTTPLGTYPTINNCVNIPYSAITSKHLCYDLIYNPAETLFLTKSRLNGAATINGLEMLKIQADKSWEVWNS